MISPAQSALAEGFAALAAAHDPDASWSFGAESFSAVATQLKADDPRLEGSADRTFEVTILSDAPAGLARSQEIRQHGVYYRITRRPDVDPTTGKTTLVVVRA